MTAYLQVHDILDRAQETHRRLGEFYERLSKVATGGHVKMLLNYLSQQEKNFAQSLEVYVTRGSPKVLQTWFQFAPESHLQETLAGIDLQADMTVDQVMRVAMRLDDCLVAFYDEALQNAEGEEVADAFRELLIQEKQEKAELFKTAESLKHI